MSDIIHLLPDSVANQIAAGEVIQRPASIIKELVENSIDAGATHVQVVVEEAGKSLVQVIDNGCGMSATDARMSFERHATSKITQATDLFALSTMGFRGEALASIAAVAQVELRTRPEGAELGTCLTIDGSKVTGQEPVSCPVGANFAVRNLFFNIPARRKFLKSNQTELTNILTEFERIALAHPDIAFTLHSAGNVMMDLPAGNFRKRILGVFGNRIDKTLVPVDVETTLAHISGFVGMPSAARKKNAHQYLFVNGRFMRHPYFAKAILMAYERLIPDGQQVPFFIRFEVDPARIDVNIHPTKTEIKFEDDNAIFQILMAAVRESLGKYGAVPAIDFNNEERFDLPIFNAQPTVEAIAPPTVHIDPSFNPFEQSSAHEDAHAHSTRDGNKESGNTATNAAANALAPNTESHPETFESQAFGMSQPLRSTPTTFSSKALGTPSHATPEHTGIDWENVYESTLNAQAATPAPQSVPSTIGQGQSSGNEIIESALPTQGTEEAIQSPLFKELPDKEQHDWTQCSTESLQYCGRFLITPLNGGLAIVDQHRAHTRVLYEHYRQQLKQRNAPSQRMLFPEMISISPSEGVMLEHIMPQLTDIGFDLSPLGNNSYSILAMPSGTDGLSAATLVSSILADAMSGQADAADMVHHIIANSLAKKVAMPVGQCLNGKEMGHLLQQLLSCESPTITPDGAPTLVMLPEERISSWF